MVGSDWIKVSYVEQAGLSLRVFRATPDDFYISVGVTYMSNYLLLVYTLIIAPTCQTNHELTHVKVFLCVSMLNTQLFKTREKVTIFSIFIYWVEPPHDSQVGSILVHISGLQDLASTSTSPRSSSMNNLLPILSRLSTMSNLSQFMLHDLDTYSTPFALNSTIFCSADSIPPRESKTCPVYPLLCGISLA